MQTSDHLIDMGIDINKSIYSSSTTFESIEQTAMAGWFMILQGISTAHAVMDILSVSLKTPLVLKVCVNICLENLVFK